MKIAFVSQPLGALAIPPTDSTSIVTYEIARRLARSGDVIIYGRKGHAQPKMEYDGGGQLRRVSIGRDIRYLRRSFRLLERFSRFFERPYASSLYYLDYCLQVANDLRAQQCDIVHIHNFSQFAPIIRFFNPNVKIALQMHCEWLTQLDRAMIERRLKTVDLIIGCSEHITKKIRDRFPQFANRCQTIANGVDVNSFIRKNDHGSIKNGDKRLLFVGRVSPEKGLHILLDALELVIQRYPHTQLEIIGSKKQLSLEFLLSLGDADLVNDLTLFYDGNSRSSYLSHLHKQLDSLGIVSHVTFLGPVPYTQVANHYRDADVLVNPSLSEAFGRSLIEAMSCEVPVVATRVGGMPEIVQENRTGLLVEAGDAPALAKAILRLLASDDLRRSMGKAGRQRVLDFFSWEQITKNLSSQYQRIYEGV